MKHLPTELPTLKITDKKKESLITKTVQPLILDGSIRTRIKTAFLEEMRIGLSANPERKSSLQMENTYISELTNGAEEGTFLALDLGGTNFRVMLIQLVKGLVEKEDVSYYDIPQDLFLSEGVKLFDFLANSIADFLHKRSLMHQHFNLGFTFSFPMVQEAINIGILTNWTKSFNCPGVIGENVVLLLNEAIKRNPEDLDITVTSVLNDTTGTLVQGSYLDKRCAIGMILGTGHNACYLEKVRRIPKWKGTHTEKEVVMDIEWGSFGDNGVLDFMRTKWDYAVDDKSLLRKSFTYEKYIGGKYLCDIVREVLFTLTQEGLLGTSSPKILEVQGALKTSCVGKMDNECMLGGTSITKDVLENLGLHDPTDDDIRITQYVCGIVSYRASLMVALLSSILIDRMDKPHCTIAIDGSLFKHHPRFKPLIEHLIKIYSPGKSFSLLLASDGSGKGAGLVAAIEERMRVAKLHN